MQNSTMKINILLLATIVTIFNDVDGGMTAEDYEEKTVKNGYPQTFSLPEIEKVEVAYKSVDCSRSSCTLWVFCSTPSDGYTLELELDGGQSKTFTDTPYCDSNRWSLIEITSKFFRFPGSNKVHSLPTVGHPLKDRKVTIKTKYPMRWQINHIQIQTPAPDRSLVKETNNTTLYASIGGTLIILIIVAVGGLAILFCRKKRQQGSQEATTTPSEENNKDRNDEEDNYEDVNEIFNDYDDVTNRVEHEYNDFELDRRNATHAAKMAGANNAGDTGTTGGAGVEEHDYEDIDEIRSTPRNHVAYFQPLPGFKEYNQTYTRF